MQRCKLGGRWDSGRAACSGVCALLACATLWLAGCSTTRTTPDGTPQFSLKLRRATTDGRYTMFEIKRDGQFFFGGGRDATLFNSKPIGTVTDLQRKRIWELITAYKLEDASSSSVFDSAKNTTYDFAVSERGELLTSSIRVYDDQAPGLKELHDLLLDYQSQMRNKTMPVFQR